MMTFMTLLISIMSCAQNKPHRDVKLLQASGMYKLTGDKIYVDANLKQTSKSNAVYYLEKDVLGTDLVLNDSNTGNYWQDYRYFQDTPVVRFIYYYYNIKDGTKAFVAKAAEWQGKPTYLFDGLAFFQKGEEVTAYMNYKGGKLDGEYVEVNEDRSLKFRKIMKDGKETDFYQTSESIDPYFVGKWQMLRPPKPDDSYNKKTYLVNEYKADGSIEAYENIHYDEINGWSAGSLEGLNKSKGFWKFKRTGENTGIMEVYFNGRLFERDEMIMKDRNTLVHKVIYTDVPPGTPVMRNYTMKRQ